MKYDLTDPTVVATLAEKYIQLENTLNWAYHEAPIGDPLLENIDARLLHYNSKYRTIEFTLRITQEVNPDGYTPVDLAKLFVTNQSE